MARSVTGDSQLPLPVISCEDVGRILMIDVSIFFSRVSLRVRCDGRIASHDDMHVRVFNGVGWSLPSMWLQVLQQLRLSGSGAVGANSGEIIGHDAFERRDVRGA